MELKYKQTMYPYIQPDNRIEIHPFHSVASSLWGVCLREKGDGIDVEISVEVEGLENTNAMAIAILEIGIQEERAACEQKVADMELAKQKLLALEVTE